MTIEHEIKLTADMAMVLPDLGGVLPESTVGPPSQLALAAVYYDTPTLSLARAGVTLRSRTGESAPIWTLKLPTGTGAGGLSRSEYTFDEPLGAVPLAAFRAATAYIRSQTLGPVVRLHTNRTEIQIELDGKPLLVLCDDIVVAEVPNHAAVTFREIELELASEDVSTEAVDRLVESLRAAGCRDDDPIPKASRALGYGALAPPDVHTMPIGRRSTAGAVVRHAIASSVTQLLAHHAGVWLGNDQEDVHQFRVAARRLRSDLHTFAPVLDRRRTTWLRDELKWLGSEAGRARDVDVLAERLHAQMNDLAPNHSRAVRALSQRLDEHIADARSHVEACLSSDRYVALLDALVDSTRDPSFESTGLADKPARTVFLELVRGPWRKLRKAADELGPDSVDPEFHAVRILAKQARYATEAVAPVYGRDARRFARAIAEVQTVLGDHQDTAVAEEWLRGAAKDLPSTRLAVAELVTIERNDRFELRKTFKSVWKKTSRRKLRTWMKKG